MLPIVTDILNIIFEYNPEHRPLFEKSLKRIITYPVLKEIEKVGAFSRINKILNEFDKNIFNSSDYDLEKLIKKQIHDPNFIIKSLNKCNCCQRHNTNKPKNLKDKSVIMKINCETQIHYTPTHSECNCYCRHFSRFIYRSFNNIMDKKIPFSTKWLINV
uniref:Uncharacterized protein n=1 Tax=viral metagenome TaxID=1070528 RepID=A0A6C0L322_9ZZZZ|tara:strand:+ start:6561 stop:7040 length:480 start_codon:yes stop_codon:yes gene_type:complete